MGYVMDTAMSQLTPLKAVTPTVGTWTEAVASHIWTLNHTAAADTSVLKIPIFLPGNSAALKGAYLKSIDVWYSIGTLAATDVNGALYQATLPAQAGTLATAAVAVTNDAGHQSAANRGAIAQHQMTFTLNTPIWVPAAADVLLELTVQATATAVIALQGARANYTLRM
ncbi:MAG: hypothetical protein P4L50_15920 [Anaerolineaceae bacterium]|nr:hypothetical protein [Anaerolineaceae bacterium]